MALSQLGFRPFFLFGTLFGFLAIAAWVAILWGTLTPFSQLDPVLWHSHEMVFGFAGAIVAGFILTAIQNWTGIPGIRGPRLLALVLLWALGRLALVLPMIPHPIAAAVDLAFYPALALALVPYYLKDRELRAERVFFAFFSILFAGSLLVHLDALEILPGWGRTGVFLGLDTVILMIVFIGGRVIPFFTESSIAKAQPRTWKWVERASHATAFLFLALDFAQNAFSTPGLATAYACVAFVAAIAHAVRLYGWHVRRIARVPLIWVLHAGYAWLVLGFGLSGWSALGRLPSGIATHALTMGALGVIVYGMISRVALGHTGRALRPSAWTVAGYYLLNGAAFLRVFGPWISPIHSMPVYAASALLWGIAFGFYLFVYGPILSRPRVDGRPG